jgi:hypothetical protein
MEPNWGLDLAINGNGWKQTANDDLIKSVCYLPLLAVIFRYLPTLLPDTKTSKNSAEEVVTGKFTGDFT